VQSLRRQGISIPLDFTNSIEILSDNYFKFAKIGSLPITALTSFPGSGVTWTRQLIEGVTGIFTSTVYNSEPPILIKGIFH
jgi:hypothetical protein